MSQTDPVGDLLAIIKNALQRRTEKVSLPHSKLKESVCIVLKDEGYLLDVKSTEEDGKKTLHVYLRYDDESRAIIRGLKRVSRPGRRVFRGVKDLGKVLDGLGISVLSTSRGVISDRTARKDHLGGEIICKVW